MKLLVLFLVSTVWARPLNEQEHLIAYAVHRHCGNEAFMRAVLRVENGRKGSEAGLNPITPQSFVSGDVRAYCDYLAPCGSEQHVRLARRMNLKLQEWVFRDPQRRAEWLQEWSTRYLAGGRKAKTAKQRRKVNHEYFRVLQKVWKQERKAAKGRTMNPRECP